MRRRPWAWVLLVVPPVVGGLASCGGPETSPNEAEAGLVEASVPIPSGTASNGTDSSVDAALPPDVAVPPPFHCTRTNDSPRYKIEEYVGRGANLYAPWGMAFLPDSGRGTELLFTERGSCGDETCETYGPGRIRLVRGGVLRPEPVQGAAESLSGPQGGTLDIRVHPNFAVNSFVYVSYVDWIAGSFSGEPMSRAVHVARYVWRNDRLEAGREIFGGVPSTHLDDHFGGRMVFGADGKLYLTLGDRHLYFHPQDPAFLNGKVLRLNDDGTVPSDNPFVGVPDARGEVFTRGHRNPQGLAVQPGTGALFATEHGNSGGDEINLLLPGHNYGYPLHEHQSTEPGMDLSLREYTPSIAPSGATFYNANTFPGWCDSLFVAGLVSRQLVRVLFQGSTFVEEEFIPWEARVRDVVVGPDGYIYFSEDDVPGRIMRIVPAP